MAGPDLRIVHSVGGLRASLWDDDGVYDVEHRASRWSCSCGASRCAHVEVVRTAAGTGAR